MTKVQNFLEILNFKFVNFLDLNSIIRVLPKRCHLNGNTLEFHPQTQKLERQINLPQLNLAMTMARASKTTLKK